MKSGYEIFIKEATSLSSIVGNNKERKGYLLYFTPEEIVIIKNDLRKNTEINPADTSQDQDW